MMQTWKRRARKLKTEPYALYLAYRDPRVPWYAKVVAALVLGYVFSPIDLIPDFIPVLGLLDDMVVVPIGVAIVLKMIPEGVMAECRQRATELEGKPTSRTAAFVIVAVWLLVAALGVFLAAGLLG